MSNSKMCVSSCVIRRYSASSGSSIGSTMRSRYGSANGEHAFRQLAGLDVLLLELALRLVEHERHFEREVVLEVRADELVGALGVADDPLEMLLDLRVVVDLEVIGRVDVPLEVVVADLVLAVVRDVARLRRGLCGDLGGSVGQGRDEQPRSRAARSHQRDGAAPGARARCTRCTWVHLGNGSGRPACGPMLL